MNSSRRTALMALAALGTGLVAGAARAEKKPWNEAAFAKAQKQNRAILVDIYADW